MHTQKSNGYAVPNDVVLFLSKPVNPSPEHHNKHTTKK